MERPKWVQELWQKDDDEMVDVPFEDVRAACDRFGIEPPDGQSTIQLPAGVLKEAFRGFGNDGADLSGEAESHETG